MKYPEACPREANLFFQTLPHFFTDEEVFDAVKLPNRKQTTTIKKATIPTEDGDIYSGNAVCKLLIENEQQLLELTQWAEKSCSSDFSIFDLKFYCNISLLLECEKCKANRKAFRGHHQSYCRAIFLNQRTAQNENSPVNEAQSKEVISNSGHSMAIEEIREQCDVEKNVDDGITNDEFDSIEQNEKQLNSTGQSTHPEATEKVYERTTEDVATVTNQPKGHNLRSRKQSQTEKPTKSVNGKANLENVSSEPNGD